MPITVEAYAQYLTGSVNTMRGADFDSQVFIRALKGQPFANYAFIKAPDSTWKKIDSQHPDVASEIFIAWATERILQRKYPTSICFVPVPNKSALISDVDQPFPTLVLAQRLAEKFAKGVKVFPALRWKRMLLKAQSGGPRQAWELYPELAFVAPPDGTPQRVVLVDDVCTGGGHLQACGAKLLHSGGYVVDYAVCGGKTMHEQQPDPFSIPTFDLEDYLPSSNPFGFTQEPT